MAVIAVPTIATAVKAGIALIGAGKIAVLPFLIAAFTYFHYDQFDPENRPVSNVFIFLRIQGENCQEQWEFKTVDSQ